jgi:hypothetical protein
LVAALDAMPALCSHQPRHALAADLDAAAPELAPRLAHAVDATIAASGLGDLLDQLCVADRSW